MHVLFLIVSLLTTSFSVEIPSSLKKCNRKEGNFAECLKTAVQDVLQKSKSDLKEIGLPVLDPLEIPDLTIGAGSGTVAFSQHYTNLKVFGLSSAQCDKIEMNFDAKTMSFDCFAPSGKMAFNYDIDGKLLLLPITGHGTGNINLDKLHLRMTFQMEEVEKKGKKHYKVTDSKTTLDPEHIHFQLDNLFNGDKTLGDNINQVLNDNWADVFKDVREGYEQAMGQILDSIFNHVLSKVSEEELWGEL